VVEIFRPDRIYLVGSAARGDAGPDSDYDLMIVVPDATQAAMPDTGPAYRALWRLGPAVACWFGRAPTSTTASTCEPLCLRPFSGRASCCTQPDPRRLADTASWLRKASNDLRYAGIDLAAEPPASEDAVFHCQQAVEKAL
jgi:hypothetical protein